MIKHAKPKNFVYYLKRLTVLAVALCFIMQIPVVIKHFDSIDIEGILDKSELKNVHFKAKVQKIEQGALTAYFMEEHSNPIVSISFIFQNAGAAHDDENKQGMALLAAALLTEGAGDYDSGSFKEAAEENGRGSSAHGRSGLHAADFFHIHHISLTVDRNIEGTHDGISSCQNRSICCHVQADTISK